jgi:DNA-directed RNA polymerase specialized sigma24 family protein
MDCPLTVSRSLHGFAFYRLRSSPRGRHVLDDSQDALDATVLRVEQALSYFKGELPVRDLVDRIADTVCLDQLRVRRKRETD